MPRIAVETRTSTSVKPRLRDDGGMDRDSFARGFWSDWWQDGQLRAELPVLLPTGNGFHFCVPFGRVPIGSRREVVLPF